MKSNYIIARSSALMVCLWLVGVFAITASLLNAVFVVFFREKDIHTILQIALPCLFGFAMLFITAIGHPKGTIWSMISSVIVAITLSSILMTTFGVLKLAVSRFSDRSGWLVLSVSVVVLLTAWLISRYRGIWEDKAI